MGAWHCPTCGVWIIYGDKETYTHHCPNEPSKHNGHNHPLYRMCLSDCPMWCGGDGGLR